MENRAPTPSGMTTRQKILAAVIAIILVFIIYELIDMFRGTGTSTLTPSSTTTAQNTPVAPVRPPPQAAQIPESAEMTAREMRLMKLQQETEGKYLAAVNELQMLKMTLDIAQINRDITSAKLATVVDQKKIIDVLAPAPIPIPPTAYAKNLISPTSSGGGTHQSEISYTVVSVSQLQDKWNAVLGASGNLYSVHIGDILPPDGSRVISINQTGVVLERDNIKKKVSLVPII